MRRFTASTINCYEEDDVLVIALSDNAENPANYMIITRLDNEDNTTVNDGIGLQTDQAEYEMPDVIEKVIIDLDILEVVIKPEFSCFFGSSRILAELPPEGGDSSEQVLMLKNALRNIFSGTNVELVI